MISYHSEWLPLKQQQITSVVKDTEKREPSCSVGGIVNCCSRYGRQYGSSSRARYYIGTDKQAPNVQHQELCSMFRDKPSWKRI